LEPVGFGTEKLEEDLQAFFPETKVQRMDLDTTRSKYSYQRILDGFEEGKIDILVGTQMVSKGLDFDHVSLVGILDMDRMIHFPDFRAEERSFQLITQVSGRAGRREKRGKVIIQTRETGQPLLKTILSQHMREFYDLEIEERKKFHFPPFTRLVKVTIKHLDRQVAQQAAHQLFQNLRKGFQPRMIHEPHEPLISKIRNKYLVDILMKFDRHLPQLKSSKNLIREQVNNTLSDKNFRKVNFVIDVDPY